MEVVPVEKLAVCFNDTGGLALANILVSLQEVVPVEKLAVMYLDLALLDSVRQFADTFRRSGRLLVCSAAVYLPTANNPTFAATNHLEDFLLLRLLLVDLKQSDCPQKRPIIVDSITGNTNTMAGNEPPKANPGDLKGLARVLNGLNSSPMIEHFGHDIVISL